MLRSRAARMRAPLLRTPAAEMPTIVSVSPSSGSLAGGTTVTITLDSYIGAREVTGVTIGGVACTSVTQTSDTTVTAITGAHAAGLVSVVVTTPWGSVSKHAAYTYAPQAFSLTAASASYALAGTAAALTASRKLTADSVAYALTGNDAGLTYTPSTFDPATLSLTGWWRADGGTGYNVLAGVGTFAAVASAGASGTNGTLSESTNAPSDATALNGHDVADFDGTADLLKAANDFSTFVTATAGTILVLFNADTAAAAAANNYDDPALVCDENNGFNIGFSDGGVGFAYYDGTWVQPARVTCATGGYHVAKCRWDGTHLETGVDSGAMGVDGAGNLQFYAGSKLTVGRVAISATAYFDGKVAEVITADSKLSNADIANVISYFNDRYGLSL